VYTPAVDVDVLDTCDYGPGQRVSFVNVIETTAFSGNGQQTAISMANNVCILVRIP